MKINEIEIMLIDDEDIINTSSSEDEDYDVVSSYLISLIPKRESRTAITNYIDVIHNYSEEEFTKHFRINWTKVNEITEKFANSDTYLNLLQNANTRTNISAEKHLLIFLWFAGHQACYRDVADRFDLSLSSVHDVITRIINFLNLWASEIIKLPSAVRKREISTYYYNKTGFPHIIGAIDGSHIKIDKPTERSVDYYNRKDYYSIVLQGVCDHELNFIDVFIGYPGSAHDARIFRNSTVYNELAILCEGSYLLGDSAYPLLLQLLTPYRDNGHLTNAQKMFNRKLSSCRVSIEHAFGLLKQRFRQLYHVKLRGHERICQFLLACCVLHNIASKEDENIFNQEEQEIDLQPQNNIYPRHLEETGADIRDEICRQLYLRR